MNADELNWFAGLLEGEGSFFPGSPSCPHLPVLTISMADEDVMQRVGRILGRSVRVIPPRREGWRFTYAVTIKGAGAVSWMQQLRPLMGQRRQAQIDRALSTYAPRSKQRLDDERASRALSLLAAGASVREVADRFAVSIWCIYDLRLGRTHRHLARSSS